MELNYIELLKTRTKSIKELEAKGGLVNKKIAVLSDSSTQELKAWLKLFCLKISINIEFFSDEFGMLYEDSCFGNDKLKEFNPDLIIALPSARKYISNEFIANTDDVTNLLISGKNRLKNILSGLSIYGCPVILSNFPNHRHRVLGNIDALSPSGINYQIKQLNLYIDDLVQTKKLCYLCDFNYLSSLIGLKDWFDETQWYMFRYDMSQKALMYAGYELSKVCRSLLGYSKKVLVCDLDNTLWGGVVGEDGVDGISIGSGNIQSEIYSNIQTYIKALKQRGIVLAVSSKNNIDEARAAFKNSNMILSLDDFAAFKANWEPKSKNISEVAKELSLGIDSFVFFDDNPTEREEVRLSLKDISIIDIKNPLHYVDDLDFSGFFETISLTSDDLNRAQMYKERAERESLKDSFVDYNEYLQSLCIKTSIERINDSSIDRCAQLINKTNQFNLTTIRYTKEQLESMAKSPNYLCLLARSKDKFGDNGIVSVLIAKIDQEKLYIDTWLMSCRVIKKGIEFDIFDIVKDFAKDNNILLIEGKYIRTEKNSLVQNLYDDLGFKIIEDIDGIRTYCISVSEIQSQSKNVAKIVVNI